LREGTGEKFFPEHDRRPEQKIQCWEDKIRKIPRMFVVAEAGLYRKQILLKCRVQPRDYLRMYRVIRRRCIGKKRPCTTDRGSLGISCIHIVDAKTSGNRLTVERKKRKRDWKEIV